MSENNMIINIVGISGAGKTTLAKRLSKEYNLKILSISEYRNKYHDETTAWQELAKQVSDNTIIDTSGLNPCLTMVLPKNRNEYITILVKCTLSKATKRNKNRKEGYFPYTISREELNKSFQREINKGRYFGYPANITINTTNKTKKAIYKEVIEHLWSEK